MGDDSAILINRQFRRQGTLGRAVDFRRAHAELQAQLIEGPGFILVGHQFQQKQDVLGFEVHRCVFLFAFRVSVLLRLLFAVRDSRNENNIIGRRLQKARLIWQVVTSDQVIPFWLIKSVRSGADPKNSARKKRAGKCHYPLLRLTMPPMSHYAHQADALFAQYNRIDSATLHADWLKHLPERPGLRHRRRQRPRRQLAGGAFSLVSVSRAADHRDRAHVNRVTVVLRGFSLCIKLSNLTQQLQDTGNPLLTGAITR